MYGALLCQQLGCDSVMLELIYLDIDHWHQHPERRSATAADLNTTTSLWTGRWQQWQLQEQHHRQQRNQHLQQLAFLPEGFRPGQHHLSRTAYLAIRHRQALLLQAPTGLGKTIGVLFPALKAMTADNLDRIFFLTARTTGRQLALDGLQRLLPSENPGIDGHGALRVLELIAKEKACEYPQSSCHPDSCPLAQDFYERLPAARQAATRHQWLDQRTLRATALTHRICPWYLGHEMAKWSDVIIGDVNHYFDQSALLFALTRQFAWRSAVLIDEAHNLIERARSMYSLELRQDDFDWSLRTIPKSLTRAHRQLQKCFHDLEERCFENSDAPQRWLEQLPEGLTDAISQLHAALGRTLVDHPDNPELQQCLFNCHGYLNLAATFASHSVVELRRDLHNTGELWDRSHLTVRIHNLIPAPLISQRFASSHASILFSATLQPAEFYRHLLGLPADSPFRDTPSPFHSHQVDVVISPINTRNDQRQASAPKLAHQIHQHFVNSPGNHLIFFSSFDYLRQIRQQLEALPAPPQLLIQDSQMSERQQRAFLRTLQQQRGILALAVLGGVFSEGVDLPGDSLVSVSVVTLGLPPFDPYHSWLEQRMGTFFGEQQQWAYTWLYPGIRRVIQAAGRLIRTPEDYGSIRLYDQRFQRADIMALLPSWWFGQPDRQNEQIKTGHPPSDPL